MFGLKKSPKQGKLSGVGSYMIYYGPGSSDASDALKGYDLVVVEPRQWTKEDLFSLRGQGVLVYGYFSVMESAGWNDFRQNRTSDADLLKIGGNELYFAQWDSRLMDLRSVHYRGVLLDELAFLMGEWPLDGLFLDTVGDIEEYVPEALKQETREAYRSMLAVARGRYPHAGWIQNRGYETLDSAGMRFDGILWEDWRAEAVSSWMSYWIGELRKLRSESGVALFAQYADPSPESNKAAIRCGFVPCCIGDYNKLPS